MKKRKLKPFVKISVLGVTLFVFVLSVLLLTNNKSKQVMKEDSSFTYVNDYIFDNYYPVINTEEKIVKPYNSENVSLYKNFYDKDATVEEQKKSIIYYEGIYMQNSGVDYKSDETFDVVASVSGTVTNITEDTLLGKTIEIKNSNEITTMYQSLGEVIVKKGDTVKTITVTAPDGTVSQHKITIHKKVNDLGLDKVYLNGRIATRIDENTFEIDVRRGTLKADINAIAHDEAEYVSINGNTQTISENTYTNCDISSQEVSIKVIAMFEESTGLVFDQEKDYKLKINVKDEEIVIDDLRATIKVDDEIDRDFSLNRYQSFIRKEEFVWIDLIFRLDVNNENNRKIVIEVYYDDLINNRYVQKINANFKTIKDNSKSTRLDITNLAIEQEKLEEMVEG